MIDLPLDWSRPAIVQHLSQQEVAELQKWGKETHALVFVPPVIGERVPQFISKGTTIITGSGTSLTGSATVPSGTTCMVVCVSSISGSTLHAPTNITFNSLRGVGLAAASGDSGSATSYAGIFVFWNPPAGTFTLTVTMNNATSASAVTPYYWKNVNGTNQTAGFNQASGTTTPSAQISTTVPTAMMQCGTTQAINQTLVTADVEQNDISSTNRNFISGYKLERSTVTSKTYALDTDTTSGRSGFVLVALRWRQQLPTVNYKGLYLDSANPNTAVTSGTFQVDIGTAPSSTRRDRLVVVGVGIRGASGAPNVNTVVVNGVSAAQIVTAETTAFSSDIELDFWVARVPTGSGTVTVTTTYAAVAVGTLAVWTVHDAWYSFAVASVAPDTNGWGPWTGPSFTPREKTLGIICFIVSNWSVYSARTFTLTPSAAPSLTKDFQGDHGYTAALSGMLGWHTGQMTSVSAATTTSLSTSPQSDNLSPVGHVILITP
jgi:hypothetical protein